MQKAIAVFAIAVFAAAAAIAQGDKAPDEKPDAAGALAEAKVYERECGFTNAAAALARYNAVLADYPDADASILMQIQYGRAFSILRMGDYAAALVELTALVRDFPDEDDWRLANASMYAGICHQKLGDQPAAQATYERVLTDYPNAGANVLSQVAKRLSDLLADQGQVAEANAVRMQAIRDYAWHFTIPDEKHVIWAMFDTINPSTLSSDEYRSFLVDAIKAVKATEQNARFLGRMKSELEKVK
jgi:TolA-binding protein